MYKYETKIGYSSCNPVDKIKIPELVNLLQNCSMFHSAAIGMDLDRYREMNKAWLLSSWQIEIEDLPMFNEDISVCTKSHDIRGFFAGRNFWIERQDGSIPVKANTIWFYVDTVTGKPVRVPQSEIDGYGIEEKLEMNYEARKMEVPKEMKELPDKISVNTEMLDSNFHVNNSQYIKAAYELVQKYGEELGVKGVKMENAGFYPSVKTIRVEYRNAAKFGNVFCPFVCVEDDTVFVEIRSEDNNCYAVVAFKCE